MWNILFPSYLGTAFLSKQENLDLGVLVIPVRKIKNSSVAETLTIVCKRSSGFVKGEILS